MAKAASMCGVNVQSGRATVCFPPLLGRRTDRSAVSPPHACAAGAAALPSACQTLLHNSTYTLVTTFPPLCVCVQPWRDPSSSSTLHSPIFCPAGTSTPACCSSASSDSSSSSYSILRMPIHTLCSLPARLRPHTSDSLENLPHSDRRRHRMVVRHCPSCRVPHH